MSALWYFAPLFAKQRRQLLLALGLSLITLAAGVALLGISGWFLTAAATTTVGSAFNIFGPSAAVRGLSFIRILSRYGEKLLGHNATLRLLSDIRAWLFGRLFPILPLPRRLGRADLVSRLTGDVDALDTSVLVAVGPITTAVLTGIAMSLGLWFVLPGASMVYLACFSFAALLVPSILVILSSNEGKRAVSASADLRRAVLDGLDCHQDLVLFGETLRAVDAAELASEYLAKSHRKLAALGATASAAVQVATGLALAGTLYFGVTALRGGSIDGPLLAGIVLAVVASFEASATLVRSAARLASATAAAERLRVLATSRQSIMDPILPLKIPSGGQITFEGVTFGHDPVRPIFKDLSFSISTGSRVAIVGPSGAGKSTIAQLIVRLCDPQDGVVRLNGVDLRNASLDELRRGTVLMTQDAPVFLDTIRNNLLIGRPNATDRELWDALSAVRLDTLSDTLDSYVGEAGQTLSTGQARRLCLARTLLSEADVIILDEPTTGMDRETESEFLADLACVASGRTIIIITHASLPAIGFDAVLNLRAGQLVPFYPRRRPEGCVGTNPAEAVHVKQ